MAAPAPRTVVFPLDGRISRTDLPALCERMSALLERTGAHVAICDVSRAEADAVTVDAVARLRLTTLRLGCRPQLRGASSDLACLLAFTGLRDTLEG
jgi:hypothetical protein